ncbi:MAG: N-formylglutamate amidohydrolase, partial [Allosphingosinicella sp.]
PVIEAAVMARNVSSRRAERVAGEALYGPAPTRTEVALEDLEQALIAGKILCYAQGFAMMTTAAGAFGWALDMPRIARVWRAGCIIRSAMLNDMAAALAEARNAFGIAVLLDCHSMPPRAGGEPPIVLGDRHGASMAPEFVAAAEAAVREAGFRVSRNLPYAGGHITEAHGRPEEDVHALQIEIDRSVYLGPDLRSPGPGFDRTARLIGAVARALADAVLAPPAAIAAE